MHTFPERDWKVFSDLHGVLMERFCERVLNEVVDAANNSKHEPSQLFSTVARLMRERSKDLNDLADHRRSTAFFIIARMRYREKLFLPGEFERFSDETRNKVIALETL
jgi:hypothetical protein